MHYLTDSEVELILSALRAKQEEYDCDHEVQTAITILERLLDGE